MRYATFMVISPFARRLNLGRVRGRGTCVNVLIAAVRFVLMDGRVENV